MTVAEIQEFITQKINYYKGENYYHTLPTNTVLLDFEQIGIMLDELEPKENDTLALFANTLDAHIGTHSKIINIELPQEQAIRIKESILESIKIDQSKFIELKD